MKYKEFLEYLEANLDGYTVFLNKSRKYQLEKNAKRPAKGRWSDEKIEKAVVEMWKKAMEPLYNTLKKEVNSEYRELWITFMEKNDIFESVNEGISELDFNGGA